MNRTAGQTPPAVATDDALLLSGPAVCARLDIGVSLFHAMRRLGRFPLRPIKLGGAVRFRADELSAWVAAGCPNSEHWRAMREGAK